MTRCHVVFTTAPMGISTIGQSPKTVDSAWLSLIGWKSCEQRKSTLYDVRALGERFDRKSRRNLMRMIPRYRRRQLEGTVSRNKTPLSDRYLIFFSAIINRTWTAPRGATRWSRKFCRLLWRICPRCSTLRSCSRLYSAHILQTTDLEKLYVQVRTFFQ